MGLTQKKYPFMCFYLEILSNAVESDKIKNSNLSEYSSKHLGLTF